MMRRLVAATMVAAIGLFALAFGTDGQAQEKKKNKGTAKAPYVHAVIFHFKKDSPKDAAENAIADAHKLLAKIPTVRGVWAGPPAEKSTPKFVVKDYDVGLLVLFDNYEGLQEYLDHALHTEYVEKHAKHFEKVTVYDFMNQNK
jgi:stress responsive alpha/beta barrel protein